MDLNKLLIDFKDTVLSQLIIVLLIEFKDDFTTYLFPKERIFAERDLLQLLDRIWEGRRKKESLSFGRKSLK